MRWMRKLCPPLRSRTQLLSIAALSLAAVFCQAPAGLRTASTQTTATAPYDGCPSATAPAQIERLPFTDTRTTCAFTKGAVASYGLPCMLQGVTFPEHEAVYKVRLHPGNKDVEFRLKSSSNLILTLLTKCGDGVNSCLRSSPGGKDQVIPKASYTAGDYYLNVDSRTGAVCNYTLTVTGTNP